MPDTPDRGARTMLVGGAAAILALCVFQVIWAFRTKKSLEAVERSVARLAAIDDKLDKVEEKLDKLTADHDFLVDDVTRISKKVDDLVASMENRGGPKAADATEMPQIDWTDPQLFETARKSCAEYGIELLADEVRVPARFVLKGGVIEYFAVLKGGKEHETLISLVGNTVKGERRPKDFAARMNNAIQAIGFKRGKPVRFTATGRIPPEGDMAFLFVEWQESKGGTVETVLARGEHLIWDRIRERPMDSGKWVYVGSSYVTTDDPTTPVFAADVTAEAVATYSSPDTIFDNTTAGDADDTSFIVATPRIPEDVEECVLVIRRKDREPTRTFPDPPRSSDAKAGESETPGGDQGGKDR